jgi:transposase
MRKPSCRRCLPAHPPTPPRSVASAGSPPPATPRRVGCSAPASSPLSWDGAQVGQIAAQLGCHPRTVYRWLHRFNTGGIDVLGDLPRSGRPRRLGELDRGQVIALARSDPPGRLRRQPDGTLGLDRAEQADQPTQWTLDALAAAAHAEGIAVGRSQVRRILQAEGCAGAWKSRRASATRACSRATLRRAVERAAKLLRPRSTPTAASTAGNGTSQTSTTNEAW